MFDQPGSLKEARSAVLRIAGERRRVRLTPEQAEAAAELLVGLWAAATQRGISPDQWGWLRHLPRAALDTILAVDRQGPASGQHKEPVSNGGRR